MKLPETIKGAIFDVDDTLLDNQAAVSFGTIHEVTRLRAIRETAKKHGVPALLSLTEQENFDAFANARYHSFDGAVWQIFFEKGVVNSDELDPEHELLREVALLKNELHAGTLRKHGRAVLNAIELVAVLAEQFNIEDKMAIASSAVRRDINIFLDELTPLRTYFPDERIVSNEDIPHGFGKPHPEPFDRAFKTLGLDDKDRSSILAFEDDPRGMISAKKAGLYVCAITSRYPADHPALVEAEPDVVIDRYADLINLIKQAKKS